MIYISVDWGEPTAMSVKSYATVGQVSQSAIKNDRIGGYLRLCKYSTLVGQPTPEDPTHRTA